MQKNAPDHDRVMCLGARRSDGEKEARVPPQTPPVPADAPAEHVVEKTELADLPPPADGMPAGGPAAHQGKAYCKEGGDAQGIGEEVHGHGVCGVLGPTQTGFEERETSLHEQDEEGGDDPKFHGGGLYLIEGRMKSARLELG